ARKRCVARRGVSACRFWGHGLGDDAAQCIEIDHVPHLPAEAGGAGGEENGILEGDAEQLGGARGGAGGRHVESGGTTGRWPRGGGAEGGRRWRGRSSGPGSARRAAGASAAGAAGEGGGPWAGGHGGRGPGGGAGA